MARKPMVTRTVLGMNVNVLCANTETKALEVHQCVVTGSYDDFDKLLKVVKKMNTNPTLVPVSIDSAIEFTECYGMDEDYFIAHAVKLDPTTRKMLESEN